MKLDTSKDFDTLLIETQRLLGTNSPHAVAAYLTTEEMDVEALLSDEYSAGCFMFFTKEWIMCTAFTWNGGVLKIVPVVSEVLLEGGNND